MYKATKINHVTILVKDKEKTEKFFTEILGLEKISVGESLWIKIGDQYVHISNNSGAPVSNTFYHFAIEYENLSDVIKGIIEKGIDVFDLDKEIRPISINSEFNKEGRQFFVRDYDGNLIELIDSGNKFFNPQ
ncbi:MAG: hypothetical protein ACD_3C00225G0012 [uncultured bacterium (gcode 4)]|uniref:VOC domain-containing protein n=1 Tax=uncultured bacterium (gcode 4) TaxID=1234023 RepID=K2GAV6_9BACT|nr:MAG: hypothetical protein ACD_3C00225G0012 [uncultured bacterium (gcode 4)]